jgi:hypothetical protein
MKIKLLFLLAIVFGLSSPSSACSNSTYEATVSYGGSFGCNQSSFIDVQVGPFLSGQDYIRLRLFQQNNVGGWDFVTAWTSDVASAYHAGPCRYIDGQFAVSPSYSGTNVYRVEVTSYILDKVSKLYTAYGPEYTNVVEPAGYLPVEVQSLAVKDSYGTTVTWASACISTEYDLDVTALEGATYEADYFFKVYESNAAGAQISLLNSTSASGEDLGDFSVPTGTSFSDWVANSVEPMFESEIASASVGHILFEIRVENNGCSPSVITTEEVLIEMRLKPFITSFDWEWNPSGTSVITVPASQSLLSVPSIGGLSGNLVSDISTPYYEDYLLVLERKINNSWTAIGEKESLGINGAAFSLNPNSVDLYAGYVDSDRPMFNESEVYKVILTVSTNGCTSDSEWSYYEVCTGCRFQKMGQTDPKHSSIYHYVNIENSILHIVNEGSNEETSLSYEVYSIDGRQQIESMNAEITIADLNKGTYLIVVKSGSDVVYRDKFLW